MADRPELLDGFLALVDQAQRAVEADRAAYREWLGRALSAMADELTETLPPEVRAAGMRFEWAEKR